MIATFRFQIKYLFINSLFTSLNKIFSVGIYTIYRDMVYKNAYSLLTYAKMQDYERQ